MKNSLGGFLSIHFSFTESFAFCAWIKRLLNKKKDQARGGRNGMGGRGPLSIKPPFFSDKSRMWTREARDGAACGIGMGFKAG